jgi:hypothetical protein
MTEKILNFKVTDRKSFIEFIGLLHQDFCFNSDSWENNNLENFLEAMERYANEIQGYYDNTNQNVIADEPSWQTFADIFKGSMMYE